MNYEETKYSQSFQRRHNLVQMHDGTFGTRAGGNTEKEGYRQGCPTPSKNYIWAEIKSSLLVKELVHDDKVQKKLVSFTQGIVERIFNNIAMNSNTTAIAMKDTTINTYMQHMRVSAQNSKERSYPVAQSKAWVNDKAGLQNNFYGLWNFLKWSWGKMAINAWNITDEMNVNTGIIKMFQQQILYFQDLVRGSRVDLKGGNRAKNDQIGITNYYIPRLKRKVRGKPDYKVEAWFHPGEVQCRIPYRGTYGRNIKQYRERNNYYGSLQCGISGSTQYILFLYLLSIQKTGTSTATDDVRDVITSSVLILTGDGGHNIREVIFGLTTSVILMYNLLLNLFYSLNDPGNPLNGVVFNRKTFGDRVRNFVKKIKVSYEIFNEWYTNNPIGKLMVDFFGGGNISLDTRQILFLNILVAMVNWYQFLYEFYNFTKDINIMGGNRQDFLNTLRGSRFSRLNYAELDSILGNSALEYLFKANSIDFKGDNATTQLFFQMENNRYDLSPDLNFGQIADIKMMSVLGLYPSGKKILNTIEKYMEFEMKSCNHSLTGDSIRVPFAFSQNKKKSSRKTTRKASRKTTRKASRKTTRKASRKTTRKASRKTTRKASRKTTRKASRKTTRK